VRIEIDKLLREKGDRRRRREEWERRRVNREGVVEVILILILDFELLGFRLLE
jgi:hypothetical protein